MRYLSMGPIFFLLAVLGALATEPILANTSFGSEQTIISVVDKGKGVVTADLDGDDDLDALAIGEVAAHYALNDGDAASWMVVDLPDGGNHQEIDALDVDRDGDLDVVVSDFLSSQLIWYPNELDTTGGLGSAQVICTGCDAIQFEFVDLDGDLDLDFVVANRTRDTFCWYENVNGDASSWQLHDLDGGNYSGASGVDVGDIDGDGDLDVVGTDTGTTAGSLVWFENLGGAASWTPHTITSGLFVTVLAVDLDLDGDVDFVGQRRNPNHDPPNTGFVDWLENTTGDGSTFTTHGIDSALTSWGTGVQAVDLDFDGDLDIVGQAVGDWLENVNGDALTWTRRSFSTNDDDLRSTAVADLDHDGDLDILAARLHQDTVSWWPNLACIDSDPDADGDGARDACDVCAGEDDFLDADGDTVPDGCDICPLGNDRVDTDDNGIPDPCEGDGTLTIDDVTAFESDSGTVSFTFTVTHAGNVDDAFTVDYQTQDGTAVAGSDYVSQSGTLAFDGAFGETQTVTVTVNGDTALETDETFTVELGTVSDPNISTFDGSGLGTIQNDDGASIRIADLTQAEGDSGGTSFVFEVTLDTAVEGGVSVDYATGDGTATVAAGDYTATSGTLVFDGTEGEVETATVTVQGDVYSEGDETFVVELSNLSNSSVVLADDLGQGTISNDDSAAVAIDDVTMTEGDSGVTTFTFTVTLSGEVESGFTVGYGTTDGSATLADSDYADTTGTLVFDGTDGDSATLTVDVQGDTAIEDDEIFLVQLAAPSDSHVTLGDGTGLGTIENDDNVSLSIDDPSVVEGSGGGSTDLVFTVTLSGDLSGGFTVPFATANGTATGGADFTATSGDLAFAGTDGETQTVTVSVFGDDVLEADESFAVELGTPSAASVAVADDTGLGTIQDDDTASITIGNATANEGDSGTASFIFIVSLSGDVQGGFTVAFETADDSATTSDGDYIAKSGLLTFAGANGESEIVVVSVQGDGVVEADETFTVDLGSPSNAGVLVSDGSGLGTIGNDDTATLAISDLAAAEGDSGPVGFGFTITLTGAVDQGFTVDYTTADGTATSASGDYDAASGTLTFDGTSGEEETLTVLVNGDTDPEDDETFTVTLGAPSLPQVALDDAMGQGLIANDDILLTVSVVGSGHVGSDPAGIDCGDGASDCEEIYAAATVVDLTATPIGNSVFDGWSGDGDCDDGNVTLHGDRDCVASFVQGQAQLAVSFSGGGYGVITSTPVGIDCDRDGDPSDCSASFDTGTTVDLAVEVTSVDTTFEGWTGDADCVDGSVDLTETGQNVVCVALLTVTPFFTDGFESGDTSAWSIVTP